MNEMNERQRLERFLKMSKPLDICFEIDERLVGERFDKAIASMAAPDFSRERVKQLIASGHVWFDGVALKGASQRITTAGILLMQVPEAEPAEPEAQDIPLDIVFEDDDLLVINKPVGLVVHPGAGHRDGTLVNALLHHCGDSLSGIGGVKRPGIVHRLDKDTSGLIMVAKNDFAHQGLASQLADRSLSRVYQAFCWGVPLLFQGKVNLPIGRDPKNRTKMTVTSLHKGREALTYYRATKTFGRSEKTISLMECRLQTGRTHQIRVHMSQTGFALIGDHQYGAPRTKQLSLMNRGDFKSEGLQDKILGFERQALHAGEIKFIHPRTEEEMHFKVDLPPDLIELMRLLNESDAL